MEDETVIETVEELGEEIPTEGVVEQSTDSEILEGEVVADDTDEEVEELPE